MPRLYGAEDDAAGVEDEEEDVVGRGVTGVPATVVVEEDGTPLAAEAGGLVVWLDCPLAAYLTK